MEVREYLERSTLHNLHQSGTGGQWRGSCPFHDSNYDGGSDNFAINEHSGLWLCRSARCGLRGSFPLFYKLLEGIVSWAEVRNHLDLRGPVKGWEHLAQLQRKEDRTSDVVHHDLPPSSFQQPITADFWPPYLTERGFTPDLLSVGLDLRWCSAGIYANRILMPFFDIEGNLLSFTARTVIPSVEPRYKNPPGSTMNQFLYGMPCFNTTQAVQRIWVHEGPFDAAKMCFLGEHALALSHNVASSRQLLNLAHLSQLYGRSLMICLDKGAWDKTLRLWAELVGLGAKALAVDISTVAKDPGELDAARLAALKAQIKPFQP